MTVKSFITEKEKKELLEHAIDNLNHLRSFLERLDDELNDSDVDLDRKSHSIWIVNCLVETAFKEIDGIKKRREKI
jgi:hypothetical protein